MDFHSELIQGKLVQRYKRFLADVTFRDGIQRTVYCPNPGSMLGLIKKGNKVWLQRAGNSKAKYPYVWKLVELDSGTLVCIDTQLANKIVYEALLLRKIPGLKDYQEIVPEPKIEGGSRLDFMLNFRNKQPCYLEVKSITLSRVSGLVEFPDSVTSRGAKHLKILKELKLNGFRAIQLYLIQRTDASHFQIAKDIDEAYHQAFEDAKQVGVEVVVFKSDITKMGINLGTFKPLLL